MDSLRARLSEVDLRWVGGRRGLEAKIVPSSGIEFDRLWLRSLRNVDLSFGTASDPFRLAASFPQALALVARWRPDALFTTGGFAAIPVIMAAAAQRIPTLLWEGNLVPGRSVRATAPLAKAIAVSYAESCRVLPGPCYLTGTPIRALPRAQRSLARQRLEVPADAPCLLIFGGSQQVRRFNEAVWSVLPELTERAHVLHVTGEPPYAESLRHRDELRAELRERYRPYPFLREEMTDALLATDLVVGRAGSSTLAEVTAAGVPIVIVPYPHAAGHQAANARTLVEASAAEVVEDTDFDGATLLRAADILADDERHAKMSAASRALGRPGAAAANVELLLALAERRALPGQEHLEWTSRGGS